MDALFREFAELMDDANDKMPEGTYLALYNKLKELKDASTGGYQGCDYRAYRTGDAPYQSNSRYQSGGDDNGSVYQPYREYRNGYQPSEPNYQPSEPSYQPSEPRYQPSESAH